MRHTIIESPLFLRTFLPPWLARGRIGKMSANSKSAYITGAAAIISLLQTATMAFRILVASYTNAVYTLTFDPASSTLLCTSTTLVGYHPSWITFHPKDRTLVFACLEQEEGKVIAIKYDPEGKGSVVSDAPSGGDYPCSLLALNEELFIANVGT